MASQNSELKLMSIMFMTDEVLLFGDHKTEWNIGRISIIRKQKQKVVKTVWSKFCWPGCCQYFGLCKSEKGKQLGWSNHWRMFATFLAKKAVLNFFSIFGISWKLWLTPSPLILLPGQVVVRSSSILESIVTTEAFIKI